MQPILTIALRAAESAADKLNYTYSNIAQLTAEGATRKDVFSKAIEDAAWRARKTIRNAHTRHHIDSPQIGLEESRDWDGQSRWVVDVAHGETNFRQGLPDCWISVTLFTKDKLDAVALVNPLTEESMTAFKGRGVQFAGRRVRADYAPIANSLCGLHTNKVETLQTWFERAGELRLSGCALSGFINLAAGRVHLAAGEGLSEHEMQIAMLIAQEAGALTGDLNARPVKLSNGQLTAAAPKLFKQLIQA